MIKGYIYKISCKSENINKCYIGSTTNFYRRVAQHKYDINRQGNRPIYKFINSNGGMDNFNFEKILEVQINERIDLFKIEKQYIKSESNLINCSIPCRNKKEYYNDNKNILIQKSKDYYKKNQKEILNKKKTEMKTCECGSKLTKNHFARHLTTDKHINYCSLNP